MACAASTEVRPFDLDACWRLNPQVAVRPERFGAMLYHFGTRRLSFCKNTTIAAVITSLDAHESARGACVAAGIADEELGPYERALQVLAESGTIVLAQASA